MDHKHPTLHLFVLGSLFLTLAALMGCTPAADSQIVIPTLMELPTVTPLPVTPSDTPLPSETPTITTSPLPPTQTQPPSSTPTVDCSDAAWWNDAAALMLEFFDTAEVARQTPRANLALVVLELQRQRRSMERLTPPDCGSMVEIASWLSQGMGYATDGYNAFLGESETIMQIDFTLANQAFFAALSLDHENVLYLDDRLGHTQFIWGGDGVTAATITAMGGATPDIGILFAAANTRTQAAFDAEIDAMRATNDAIVATLNAPPTDPKGG